MKEETILGIISKAERGKPEPQCKKKNGKLTAWGFICGFVEQWIFDDIKVEMYHEGGVYHVRKFQGTKQILWDAFDSVKDARKLFNAERRNFCNVEHWRIHNGERPNQECRGQFMHVVPWDTKDAPDNKNWGTVITGLTIGTNEKNKEAWEAHKHRLHVNAGCGSVSAEEMDLRTIASAWKVVRKERIPEHIQKDFED